MEKKFTQGNWSIELDSHGHPNIIKTDSKKDAIALVFDTKENLTEQEANAKLIAAAPDLLDVLMLLVFRNENNWHINLAWTTDTKDKIKAAIKKATE
mgnify:CR=1 FL=1